MEYSEESLDSELSTSIHAFETVPNIHAYKTPNTRPSLADIIRGKSHKRIKPPKQTGASHTIGTFVGVFVPCFVNIVNIVYFARLGYVVGTAGGLATLIGLVLSFAMVFVTVLSLSAFATNGEVESGGAYYLISRTIGPEAGAACGISLSLASIVGAACAQLGLVEAIVAWYEPYSVFGERQWDVRIWSIILSVIIGWLAQFGFPIRVVMFFRDFVRHCGIFSGTSISSRYEHPNYMFCCALR